MHQNVLDALSTNRLSIGNFIKQWVGEPNTRTYRRRIVKIQQTLENEDLVSTFTLRAQLRKLVGQSFFNDFESDNSMTERSLEDIEGLIKQQAPAWYDLLLKMLPNRRSSEEGYQFADKRQVMRKRITIITAVAVHSIAVHSASW